MCFASFLGYDCLIAELFRSAYWERPARADCQQTYLLGSRAYQHKKAAQNASLQKPFLSVCELRVHVALTRQIAALFKAMQNERRQHQSSHQLTYGIECHRRHYPVSKLLRDESGAPEYRRQQQYQIPFIFIAHGSILQRKTLDFKALTPYTNRACASE